MGKPKFEIKNSNDDRFYFTLKAENGRVIADSQTYGTKQACKNGIQSVKENAEEAEVIDLTE